MTITIKSKPYGEIEIDENQVIDFPDGLLGFDYIKKFALLDVDDQKSPFKWLQAMDEPVLAFVVIQPEDFMDEYKLVISQSDLEGVDTTEKEGLVVLAIVTIPENPSDMTANLQGPIIVNPEKKLGRQAISLSDKYHVRHIILEEMKKAEDAGE